MRKKIIGLAIFSSILMGYSSQVDADCVLAQYLRMGTPTPITMDWGRGINGITVGIINAIMDGESGAKLIAKQEEDNEKAGSGSGSGGGGGSNDNEKAEEKESEKPGESEFLGSAYTYVRAEVLGKEGNIGYAPLKRAVASASAGSVRQNIYQAVIDNFFVDMTKANQTTTEYQTQIANQRQEYVEESTKRHMTHAYKVKGFIQNDLQAIPTAALSCGCELASLAINAHTLEEMVKAELVDLSMQIELMEADAIQLLMEYQSPILLAETKEQTYGSGSGNSNNSGNNGSNSGDSNDSNDNNSGGNSNDGDTNGSNDDTTGGAQ